MRNEYDATSAPHSDVAPHFPGWRFVLAAVTVAAAISLFVATTEDAGAPPPSDRARVVSACLNAHPVQLDFQDGPTAAWYNVRCSDGSTHVVWIDR